MNDNIDNLLHRENLTLATPRQRIIAFAIDEILLSIILMIIFWDSFANATTMEQIIELSNRLLLEYMAIKIIYQTFFIMHYGASIGKIVMKIRVIEIKTLSNPNILSAFNRAVFRIASEILLYLGFLWAMFDPYKRGWHDFTARTLVING